MKKPALPILIACLLSLSGCGLLKELIIIFSPPQAVSGPTQIERSTTLTPPKPLKIITNRHQLSIRTDAVEGYDDADKTHETLKFKNGQSGKVTATLVDSNGVEYLVVLVAVGGADGGFYLGTKETGEWDFPKDTRFASVVVRSDVDFEANRVEWVAEIPK